MIINKIKRQATEVEDQLEMLPTPPSDNQVLMVDRLLTSFDRELSENMSGINGKNKFPSELKSMMETLTRELANTRPQILFLPTLDDEVKNLERCRKPETLKKTVLSQGNTSRRQQREEGAPTPLSIRRSGGGPDAVQTPAKRPLQETPETSQLHPTKMRAIGRYICSGSLETIADIYMTGDYSGAQIHAS
jgi:hypothetical protein